MPNKTTISIDNAVEQYAQRSTRQQVKRLLRIADRQNGDRLAKVAGAGSALRATLDELRKLDRAEAHKFAVTIGWGDRIPA
jgi:hypothetical protein